MIIAKKEPVGFSEKLVPRTLQDASFTAIRVLACVQDKYKCRAELRPRFLYRRTGTADLVYRHESRPRILCRRSRRPQLANLRGHRHELRHKPLEPADRASNRRNGYKPAPLSDSPQVVPDPLQY